jgi:carbonic anhydrase/acetyltransferase-like protein (isoleucine patch superfamily)
MERIGQHFIEPPYLPPGCDEYYLRNQQALRPVTDYRPLEFGEIETLVRNNNTCDNWSNLLVTNQFAPQQVHDCDFRGLVRIGRLDPVYLEHHDMRLAAGLYRSRIISCDIGDNVAIHNVTYLGNMIVGDRAILLNVNEMLTTNHAKFGNGIVKEGEPEDVRIWLQLWNETGTRGVLPFDGMLPADAYLWCKYRDDLALMDHLRAMTQRSFDPRRGFYGTVAAQSIVKDCRIIKDVKIGDHAYIKGANKLKNLTINSSADEPSQIGEGCELVNGIVGYGSKIFYGVKAVRFVTGRNTQLKYGARLINSYLGDNSTVSCCEILNNLVFPAHEQHHNNSFLCSALVMGQSNIAAGVTIGSNHNSRANDGEILAGRGFWPGLCTSLKHNCRFASFTLLSKADYPSELDVPLPFSLVSNDAARDRLQIMPAYWFMYNMYAVARNSWKFAARDTRIHKAQHIEFDYLAPDTVEEMFAALRLLERWVGRAALKAEGRDAATDTLCESRGRELLMANAAEIDRLEVLGERIEHSGRKVVILKARQAYAEYRAMIVYYGVKTLMAWIEGGPGRSFEQAVSRLAGPRVTRWVNLGGQLVAAADVEDLKRRILRLNSWDEVHAEYDHLWARYDEDKARHALAALADAGGLVDGEWTEERWCDLLDEAVTTQNEIAERTYTSRAKDFENPFKQLTFDSPAEMREVMGSAEDNSFIKQVREESRHFAARAAAMKDAR